MKTERVEITCIRCPLGCRMVATVGEDKSVHAVEGNTCAKGENYAREEIQVPLRVLTTSVKVLGGTEELVSVKTIAPIPRDQIRAAQAYLLSITVAAPVALGQIIVANLLGSSVSVLSTRAISPKQP